MTTKSKTTINKQPKTNGDGRSHEKTGEQLVKEFDHELDMASEWCIKRDVRLTLTPLDACRLRMQRDAIRVAVMEAGGPEKVPESVLVYQQILDDAASFLLAHGVGRAVQVLLGGKDR